MEKGTGSGKYSTGENLRWKSDSAEIWSGCFESIWRTKLFMLPSGEVTVGQSINSGNRLGLNVIMQLIDNSDIRSERVFDLEATYAL